MGRGLRRLILAEKFSAARRLAQILSEGMAEKVRADASSYFTFSSGGRGFSAMTPSEVRRAFANLVEPDWALAEAAAARQRIDLAWGAVLTRYLTVECGSERQVLSAGRVQTPTLRLAADRERDREDFVPRPFWNVVLSAGERSFEATAVGGPFWDEGGARALVALAGLGDTALVERVEQRDHREPPPAPVNTPAL